MTAVRADFVRPGDRLVRADVTFTEEVVLVELEPREVVIVTDYATHRHRWDHIVEILR